jgi:hypothetical protein
MAPQRGYHWRSFHEIGARADDMDNLVHRVPKGRSLWIVNRATKTGGHTMTNGAVGTSGE